MPRKLHYRSLSPKILWPQLAERYHAANTILAALLASKYDTWNLD